LAVIAHELFQIPADVIEHAAHEAREKKLTLQDVLLENKTLTGAQIAQMLAAHLGVFYIESIDVDSIPDALLSAVPIAFAKLNRLLPIGFDENDRVLLVSSNPFDLENIEELRLVLGKDVVPSVTS